MSLQITHPKSTHKVKLLDTGLVVASGTAAPSIVGVYGQWAPHSAPTQTTDGTLLNYRRTVKNGRTFYRWMIHLLLPGPGTYDLSVFGFDKTGKQYVASLLGFEAVAFWGIAVSWPDTGPPDYGDISDYKDDFVPYGTLQQAALDNVTMQGPVAGNITCLSTFSDNTDLFCWSAEFDTLTSDQNYTLTATDLAPTSAQVAGLKVN